MADSPAGDSERMGAMFPKLSAAQLARLRPIGRPRRFAAGEVVYGRGLAKRAFYVLLEGRVEIASPSRVGAGSESAADEVLGVSDCWAIGRNVARVPGARCREIASAPGRLDIAC